MVNRLGAAKDTAGWIYEFTCKAAPGCKVALAGSFNDWDPAAAPMKDPDGSGCYRCSVSLKPGYYEYKFVVDDEWNLDEENPNFAANDFGTLNSVLTVC